MIDLFLNSEKKDRYHRILLENNSYYRGLDAERRKTFIVRTHLFLSTTQFRSMGPFPISLPMKVLLSGGFVQVTFGLKEDVLDYFNRILIFDGPYAYKNSTHKFNGDVNPRTKTIHLSWPAVTEGFADDGDGINLALHEFAHCLILENARRSYLDRILNETTLNAWKEQAMEFLPRIRSGNDTIFRAYGGTNLMELFAVALEVFFEQPDRFARKEPEFYYTMSLLLNQDPRYTPDPVLP